MVLLVLFSAICWMALRLLRPVHMNKGFPEKKKKIKSLSKLIETPSHTESKAVLKITELIHTYSD